MSMKKLSLFFILIIYLIFILSFPNLIKTKLISTTILFITTVMPSILPMYLICSLLSNSPLLSSNLYPFFKKIMHFENPTSCSLYLLSILLGNPTIAILINNAVQQKTISNKEAQRITNFTFFMNPLFIINTCGKFSFILILGSIISSILIGYFSKNNNYNHTLKTSYTSFLEIVNHIPSMLLNILAIMLVITIIKSPWETLNFSWQISFLLDLLEVSLGVKNIINYSNPNLIKFILLNILLHSNGLCVLLQVSIFSKYLPFKKLIYKKIVATIITTIISLFIYFVFNC